MTITSSLDTNVFQHPYLHNDGDKEVVIQGIKNMQAALGGIANLTWILPPANTTVEAWVNGVSIPIRTNAISGSLTITDTLL
jgi:cellobiose dehydrogenase (acceptor)